MPCGFCLDAGVIREECSIHGYTKGKKEIKTLKEAMDYGRKLGLIDGIRRYAWWKDGVQYVGTCGTTLEKALAEVEKEVA